MRRIDHRSRTVIPLELLYLAVATEVLRDMRFSRDYDGRFFGGVMEMQRRGLGVTQYMKMHARILIAEEGQGVIIFVRFSAHDPIYNPRQIDDLKLPLVTVRSRHLLVFIDVIAQMLRTTGVRAAGHSPGVDFRPRRDSGECAFRR